MRVLIDLHQQDGGEWHKPKEVGQMSGEPFNEIRHNSDTMRKKVGAALEALIAEGKIEKSRDGVRLRAATSSAAV